MKKENKVIKCSMTFDSKKGNTNTKTFWVDDKEVTELEYYGIDENTTIEDLGNEPFDHHELGVWLHKKFLVREMQGDVSDFEKRTGFKLIGF